MMLVRRGVLTSFASFGVAVAAVAGCSGQVAPQDLGIWTPNGVPSGAAANSSAGNGVVAPGGGAASSAGDSLGGGGAGGTGGGGGGAGASGGAPVDGDAGGAADDASVGSGSSSSETSGRGSSSASSTTPTPFVFDGGRGTLPCDVAAVLAAKCTSCHSDPPINNALSGLVTFADLTAAAKEDPTKSEAQLSVDRMQNKASPMPPASVMTPATTADVTVLKNWINAGYPSGGPCRADAGAGDASVIGGSANVFAGQPPYALGTEVSGHHNAGQNCLSHHHNGEFSIAGTVFDANGNGVAGAEVRVIDATGNTHVMYSGFNGNFYTRGTSTMALGGHAGARNATATALMIAKPNGACNSCHASGGTTTPIHLP